MKVLGEYYPAGPEREWRAWRIGRALTRFTQNYGLIPHESPSMLKILEKCSWRDYGAHASVVRFAHPEYEGSGWHQDGDHAPGADMNCALVVWCDRLPTTEIRCVKTGAVVSPAPFEVVVFNNLEYYHRRPSSAVGKRWLFRQRVRRI